MGSTISTTEPGQPCVVISGSAPGCRERAWRTWSCTPWERSGTSSAIGLRGAARRRPRSASASSGTCTSNGRIADRSASVRWTSTAPAAVEEELGRAGAQPKVKQ
jgi:hypothetical protein